MKMEVIKEKVCKTTYKGNCLICGEEQISNFEHSVDIKCYKCRNKEIVLKIEADLLGATITKIIFDGSDIETIMLQREDGLLIKLGINRNWEESDEFYYKIIDDSKKE